MHPCSPATAALVRSNCRPKTIPLGPAAAPTLGDPVIAYTPLYGHPNISDSAWCAAEGPPPQEHKGGVQNNAAARPPRPPTHAAHPPNARGTGGCRRPHGSARRHTHAWCSKRLRRNSPLYGPTNADLLFSRHTWSKPPLASLLLPPQTLTPRPHTHTSPPPRHDDTWAFEAYGPITSMTLYYSVGWVDPYIGFVSGRRPAPRRPPSAACAVPGPEVPGAGMPWPGARAAARRAVGQIKRKSKGRAGLCR
jgi:hypothetical protein